MGDSLAERTENIETMHHKIKAQYIIRMPTVSFPSLTMISSMLGTYHGTSGQARMLMSNYECCLRPFTRNHDVMLHNMPLTLSQEHTGHQRTGSHEAELAKSVSTSPSAPGWRELRAHLCHLSKCTVSACNGFKVLICSVECSYVQARYPGVYRTGRPHRLPLFRPSLQ
jgi:hypothetical protein